LLDEPDTETTHGGIASDTGAGGTATDDQQVEGLSGQPLESGRAGAE
jgi:hypothetical protein